jgi:hypothetical protein
MRFYSRAYNLTKFYASDSFARTSRTHLAPDGSVEGPSISPCSIGMSVDVSVDMSIDLKITDHPSDLNDGQLHVDESRPSNSASGRSMTDADNLRTSSDLLTCFRILNVLVKGASNGATIPSSKSLGRTQKLCA